MFAAGWRAPPRAQARPTATSPWPPAPCRRWASPAAASSASSSSMTPRFRSMPGTSWLDAAFVRRWRSLSGPRCGSRIAATCRTRSRRGSSRPCAAGSQRGCRPRRHRPRADLGRHRGGCGRVKPFLAFRRHPFDAEAHFDFSLMLAYALPAPALEPLLAPGLEVDRVGDLGILAVALVQTRDLRPAGWPSAMGLDFFLSGYRVFALLRYRPSIGRLRLLPRPADSRL